MKEKVVLYIFRGWPGSGKSTKAKEYQQKGKFEHYFENDMYLTTEQGEYVWSEERLKEAIQWTTSKVMTELQQQKSVGLCAVFAHRAPVVEWLKVCKENGWWLEVIDCVGEYQNTHDVAPEKVARFKKDFQPWIHYT